MMPTPDHIKEASRKKRERVCVICGAQFLVRSADRMGLTCSKACLSKRNVANLTGRKQSEETKLKRSASLKAVRSDPERNKQWADAAALGIAKWHDNPVNAQTFSQRMSARMKERHADPEFQKRRDERSSKTLRATWEKHREAFTARAVERYAAGLGVNSEASIAKKNEAARWIMRQAQEALRAETNYSVVFAEVQERMRKEHPYDGPQNESDYFEYLRKIGRAVTLSFECRAIADPFMAEAISRFGKLWTERKDG